MEKRILDLLEMLVAGVRELKRGQCALKQGQEELKAQVSENTAILKALEHAAQMNKAEHDMLSYDIAGIKKDLNAVESITAKNWSDITQMKSIK